MRALGALATLALVLAGCVKEKTLDRSEPGTPIRFGASTGWENKEMTRTEYSGRDENNALVSSGSQYERIDWVGGKDMIRVICEAASGGTLYGGIGDDYVLGTPSADGRKSTAEIAPKSGDGLRWGDGDHYFYAFYPAPGTESNYAFRRNNPVLKENVGMAAASNTAKVSGVIPAVQEAILESGTSTYKPNMNYGYMYAATKVDAGDASGSISLSFLPLVTTLEFTLKNFAASPVTEKLTRVELRSKSTPLTGTFTALLSTSADPVVTTDGTTGNSVTINLPSPGITLSETTPVRFTFLTLPVEQTELTLVLSFGSDYSVKRTLALKDTELVTAENPNGWITADARKKVYISNVAVPGGNLWRYTLDVTGNYTTSVPMAGGDVNYTVQSYRTNVTNSSVKEPVTWTTQYSVDGGEWTTTCPDWLQSFNAAGPGSTASPWEPDTATLPANDTPLIWEGSTTSVATDQAAARDLSCYDIYGNYTGGTEGTSPYNTANCYVVGAPGWYRIPCVYGNAIKNETDNTSSYTGPASGASLMTGGFLNHANAHITSPWIKNNKAGTATDSPNIVIDGASLLWQDRQGLITEVVYSSDYLYFHVSETNIFQGNAVLAAKSGSTIVWSWHIWVVDNPETRLTTKTLYSHPTVNHSVQDPTPILSMDLGFCDTAPGAVRSRNVRVKFIQESSGLEIVKTINQIGSVGYNCTYYQWGRKDPMPPGIINLSTSSTGTAINKTLYQIGGATYTCPSALSGRQSIGTTIQNPSTFIKINENTYRNWTNRYDNLWNTNVLQAATTDPIDLIVCKTIYDPCPPGYKLPNKNVFSGFTLTGENYPVFTGTDTGSNLPLLTPNDPVSIEDLSTLYTVLGYYFYLDLQDHSKGTIFMARTGSRQESSGNMAGLGNYADHMTATPAVGYGYPGLLNPKTVEGMTYLTFSHTKVHPTYQNGRSYGMPIRPIGED